jgi:hypothetical protein
MAAGLDSEAATERLAGDDFPKDVMWISDISNCDELRF